MNSCTTIRLLSVALGLILVLQGHCLHASDFNDQDSLQAAAPFDSLPAIRRMGLFDLNVGVNVRNSDVKQDTFPGRRFTNHASGISARLQSSILWSYKATSDSKRFVWGDILAAEIFTGNLSSGFSHQTKGVWVAYKFEFGLGGRLRINPDAEAGLNIILLRFSRDNVSGNVSGSGITGRYRFKRILAEGGVDARHDRVLGVATDISKKIPLQVTWTARYLMKGGRNAGITFETLKTSYLQDGFQYSGTWSLKIFYGIYF